MKLSKLQEKFYQKYAPNYIAAITYRAIDEALKKNSPVKDHFLKVGTYCKVSYDNGSAILNGLYRLHIEDVEKLMVAEDASVPTEVLPVPTIDNASPSVLPRLQGHKTKVYELLNEIEETKMKTDKQTSEFYSSKVSRVIVPPIELNIEV